MTGFIVSLSFELNGFQQRVKVHNTFLGEQPSTEMTNITSNKRNWGGAAAGGGAAGTGHSMLQGKLGEL